jgi:hypothetical protein
MISMRVSTHFKSLQLNKESSSIDDLFYSISKKRIKELADEVSKLQENLLKEAKKDDSLTGHYLLKSVMFSDIPKTDEEFLFLLITINLFIGESVGKLNAVEEAKKLLLSITDMENGQKAD